MRAGSRRLIGAVVVVALSGAPGSAAEPPELERAIIERFQPSRIEVEDPARQGVVTRRGRIVVLALDSMPAKPLRVRHGMHVMDFARVEIMLDGTAKTEPAPLALGRGTRLVVLDVAVHGDRVHLLTHTAEPVPAAGGRDPVFGCTEFVFAIDRKWPPTAVVARIEQRLEWTPVQRFCAPGFDAPCFEP